MLSGADDHSIQEFSSLIIDLNSHTPMVTNWFVEKFMAVGADLSVTEIMANRQVLNPSTSGRLQKKKKQSPRGVLQKKVFLEISQNS